MLCIVVIYGDVMQFNERTILVPEATVDIEGPSEFYAPVDPNAALLDFLMEAPGDWYVIHSYSGHERKVKSNLELAIRNNDLDGEVFQVEVPMESIWEVKSGERRQVARVKLPGYVLVRMEIDAPRAWAIVRSTPGVTGFVGHGNTPIPLSAEEAFSMLQQIESPVVELKKDGKNKSDSQYLVGDVVSVIDGPFETLTATISDVNVESERVTAMVELFGRDTPVELRFNQITRI